MDGTTQAHASSLVFEPQPPSRPDVPGSPAVALSRPRPKTSSRALFDQVYPWLQSSGIAVEFPDPDLPSFDIGTRHRDQDGDWLAKPLPMTRADALHPWTGDKIVASTQHFAFILFLIELARVRYADVPGFVWNADAEFDLGLADYGVIRPDVALLLNVTHQLDPYLTRFSMDLEPPGSVRFVLAVEVTSASTRKNDFIDKLVMYCDAGVEQYVIIDVLKDRVDLWDFRPSQSLEPRAKREDGRVYIEALDVWMEVEGKNVYYQDPKTGERIADYPQAVAGWAAAKEEVKLSRKKIRVAEVKVMSAQAETKAAAQKAEAAQAEAKAAAQKAKAAEEWKAQMTRKIERLAQEGDPDLARRIQELLNDAEDATS